MNEPALPNSILAIVNFGVLGIVVYLMLSRKITTTSEMNSRLADQRELYEARMNESEVTREHAQSRSDRYEEKVSEMHQVAERELLPALIENTKVTQRIGETMDRFNQNIGRDRTVK